MRYAGLYSCSVFRNHVSLLAPQSLGETVTGCGIAVLPWPPRAPRPLRAVSGARAHGRAGRDAPWVEVRQEFFHSDASSPKLFFLTKHLISQFRLRLGSKYNFRCPAGPQLSLRFPVDGCDRLGSEGPLSTLAWGASRFWVRECSFLRRHGHDCTSVQRSVRGLFGELSVFFFLY